MCYYDPIEYDSLSVFYDFLLIQYNLSISMVVLSRGLPVYILSTPLFYLLSYQILDIQFYL